MVPSRFQRLAAACRFVSALFLFSASSTAVAAAPIVNGTVVDESGRTIPRAHVQVLGRSGDAGESTFTDELGRFRITPPSEGCRLVVSLTGFLSSTMSCDGLQSVRVTLAVAPITESIVVTATRTEAPSGQVGASLTTFTADDLDRRQHPLVADLLRSSPGVMLIRVGGYGGVSSLFVRGGESNYNKVLLDGIPLNEPGGTFNFSNLTTENVERVEIVRGAHSALFGSDAMASVVQLFTRRAERSTDRPHASVILDGGTYDTVHANAEVRGASGRLDYALGAARVSTDNRVPNNVFGNTTLTSNVGVALGSSATLRFIGRGELERAGTPGQTGFGRPDLDAFFSRHDGVGGVTFDEQVNAALRQRASYSLAVSDQASTNLMLDPPYTPQFQGRAAPFQFFDFAYDSHTDLHRHHASYQADWRLSNGSHGNQLLTVLMDWDGERALLDNRLSGARTQASRNNVGWAVQHQAVWARIFATAGARLERNDSFGTAAVPRGSIAVVVRQSRGPIGETALKAAAGLGIKEPTLLQSFSLSPSFLGNPDLEPERSRSVEAGVEQRLADDRVKVELTWFDNRFRNIISTRTTSFNPFRSQYFNIGLTRARGVELAAELAPTSALHARAGYTFLDSEILDSTSPTNIVFQAGQWAFRRPRHSGYIEAGWKWQRVAVDARGLLIGRFVDSDFSSLQPPILENAGRTTWDLRFSGILSSQLTAILSIDNLTDREYMEPLGYPALRRAVRAGVRVSF